MAEKKQMDAATLLAKTAWAEARGESDINSPLGVIFSILNRQKGHKAGKTLWSIVTEPKQYSAWNKDDPNRDEISSFGPDHPDFQRYYDLANRALTGQVADPTNGSEWYITANLQMKRPPGWTSALEEAARLGNHVFFRTPQKK
jgi:spore germination cell wall hydrolase CwlJ-like protein